MPEQTEGGGSDGLANCTSLTESDLVSTTSDLLDDHPILLPLIPDIVSNPEGKKHPLAEKGHLPLAARCVPGDPAIHRGYQNVLPKSSGGPGEPRLSRSTPTPGDNGLVSAMKGKQIHFQLL